MRLGKLFLEKKNNWKQFGFEAKQGDFGEEQLIELNMMNEDFRLVTEFRYTDFATSIFSLLRQFWENCTDEHEFYL